MSIPDAVQQELGDGWLVSHFVLIVGAQRMTADGTWESSTSLLNGGHPQYIIDGLLCAADRLNVCHPEDDDDA